MPVCICGMHRSGTSMVAHTLHQCQIYLGPEEVLKHAASDNPDGFWEDAEFVRINEEILVRSFGGWDTPPLLLPGWESRPEMASLREKALQLIDQRRGQPIWGWKDPRSSLTLPFWKSLVPGLRVVLCLRNPLEVAQSLFRRNGLSIPFGLRLWYAYQGLAQAATQAGDRIITHFDSHFSNPLAEIRRILEFLHVEVREDLVDQAAATCASAMRNHRVSLDLRQAGVPSDIAEMYYEMCRQAGPVWQAALGFPVPPPALGDDCSKVDAAERLRRAPFDFMALCSEQILSVRQIVHGCFSGGMEMLLREKDRLGGEVAARDGQLQQLRGELETSHRKLQSAQDELSARDVAIHRLNAELEARGVEQQRLANGIQERDGEIQRRSEELNVESEKLREFAALAAHREGELQRLAEELAARDQRLRDADAELALRDARVQQLGEQVATRNVELQRLHEEASLRAQEVEQLGEQVATRNAELQRLHEEASLRAQEVERLGKQIALGDARAGTIAEQLRDRDLTVDGLGKTVARLERDLQAVHRSHCWKVTRPLRQLSQWIRSGKTALQLVARILYWTVTLQLLSRLRKQRYARAIRGTDLFDPQWYLEQNPDVAAKGIDLLAHFLACGAEEGRKPNPFFDCTYYLQQNPDVAAAGINPLAHFVVFGVKEGRNPNPLFDTHWYLQQNPDVAAAGINPLSHYLKWGAAEGRATCAVAKSAAPPAISPQPALSVPALAATPDLKDVYSGFARTSLNAFLTGGARLRFPHHDRPKVSIVMVLYNRAELTLACLRSLLACDTTPFEIIVVDNGSTDQTRQFLAQIDGAKILLNEHNEGFAPAVNRGAAAATGEYLLLLNNDTQVLGNSLHVAAQFLDENRDIGAVGGRILLLDGRLQEAGCLIWQDGSTLGYGRGDDPYAPAYMYLRDVDFCSGAFLMTPLSWFLDHGGFDKDFFPAYYEDVDYCVRLWRDGRRVAYHPGINLLHYEFGSSSSAAAACQLMEQKRMAFVRRHGEWLAQQHPPFASGALPAVRAQDHRKRILVIDDRVPHCWLGSGFPRANRIVRKLVDLGYAVTFYPLQFAQDNWAEAYRGIPVDVELLLGLGVAGLAKFLSERRDYYDVVLVSRPHNMRALHAALAQDPAVLRRAKIVYDAEAVFAMREAKQAALNGEPFSKRELEQRISGEVRLAEGSDAIISVCDAEAAHFKRHGFSNVFTLGHSLEARPGSNSFVARRGLLFVGPIHDPTTPNADSVRWLLTEVMPRLQRRAGKKIDILFAGSWCPGAIPPGIDLSSARILGKVEDLQAVYDQVRLFVAPTRFSAGIPHKVHEAAAGGLPAVVSSLLAEQLGWLHPEELLASDDPDEFAEFCYRLHEDPELWQQMRQRALQAAARDCSPAHFDRQLEIILQQLLGADDRRPAVFAVRRVAA